MYCWEAGNESRSLFLIMIYFFIFQISSCANERRCMAHDSSYTVQQKRKLMLPLLRAHALKSRDIPYKNSPTGPYKNGFGIFRRELVRVTQTRYCRINERLSFHAAILYILCANNLLKYPGGKVNFYIDLACSICPAKGRHAFYDLSHLTIFLARWFKAW